jgi:hypothetical protein
MGYLNTYAKVHVEGRKIHIWRDLCKPPRIHRRNKKRWRRVQRIPFCFAHDDARRNLLWLTSIICLVERRVDGLI